MMWDVGGQIIHGDQSIQNSFPEPDPYPGNTAYAAPFTPLGVPGPSLCSSRYSDSYQTSYDYGSRPEIYTSNSASRSPIEQRYSQYRLAPPPPQPSRRNHRHSAPPIAQTVFRPSAPASRPPAPPTQPTKLVKPVKTSTLQVARPPSHAHTHSQGNASFQYSKCTGRRKALCIGINYTGQKNELRGCVNDAKRIRSFLVSSYRYKLEDIVTLTDDSRHSREIPTRQNILDAMRWLVKDASSNDSLFFHYSGHGGQTPDLDHDEVDGFDEVIFPVDHLRRGHIVDDLMHEIMVQSLPTGCRLTAVFDSCHSGTALDLPYIYSSSGRLRGSHVSARARRRKATTADVISWSGCKDSQTSSDTFANGQAVGAMSHAFTQALTANKQLSYQELLKAIREILRKKYSQKPQLSSSHPIDTSLQFVM